MYNSGLPLFFNYKEDTVDLGYENLQDFFLSWTLRCADEKYKNTNPKLHEYARHAVFSLIHGKNEDDMYRLDAKISDDFRVKSIKTMRQVRRIDLIAEIKVEENSELTKYVFNIENKWYTPISNGQLESAKKAIREKYDEQYKIIDFVIYCDEEIIGKDPNERKKCSDNKYKYLTICDIKDYSNMKEPTGNALFDEYWFNF